MSTQLTNHGLYDGLSHLDELLVDLDGEVAQHLTVLGQVEVLQTVFVLLAGVLHHERLCEATKTLKLPVIFAFCRQFDTN